MTVENRCLIELTDVTGIQFECGECKARLTNRPEEFHSIPDKCPQCQETWFVANSGDHMAMTALLNGIKVLRAGQSKAVRIRFELPGHVVSVSASRASGAS